MKPEWTWLSGVFFGTRTAGDLVVAGSVVGSIGILIRFLLTQGPQGSPVAEQLAIVVLAFPFYALSAAFFILGVPLRLEASGSLSGLFGSGSISDSPSSASITKVLTFLGEASGWKSIVVIVVALLVVVVIATRLGARSGPRTFYSLPVLIASSASFGIIGFLVAAISDISVATSASSGGAQAAQIGGSIGFNPIVAGIVLATWGAVVALASQPCAVVALRSAGVARFLVGEIHPGWGLNIERARDRKPLPRGFKIVLVVVGLSALVAGGLGLTVQQFKTKYSPEQTVSDYFAALKRNDAEGALSLSATPLSGPLLNAQVLTLQNQTGGVSDVRVGSVKIEDDTKATVSVSYTVSDQAFQGEIQLVSNSSRYPLVPLWKIANPVGGFSVTSTNGPVTGVSIAGVPFTQASGVAFPGILPLTLTNPLFELDPPILVVGQLDGRPEANANPIEVSLSQLAKERANAAIQASYFACLSTPTDTCPTVLDVSYLGGATPTWTSTFGAPNTAFANYILTPSGTVSVDASWSASGDWVPLFEPASNLFCSDFVFLGSCSTSVSAQSAEVTFDAGGNAVGVQWVRGP